MEILMPLTVALLNQMFGAIRQKSEECRLAVVGVCSKIMKSTGNRTK